MADRLVRLTLVTLVDVMHVECSPKLTIANVDDDLRFESTDGFPFRVVFEGPPFGTLPAVEISDGNPRPLRTEGRFFFKCFLTPPGGMEVGWFSGEDPESGGDVDVRP